MFGSCNSGGFARCPYNNFSRSFVDMDADKPSPGLVPGVLGFLSTMSGGKRPRMLRHSGMLSFWDGPARRLFEPEPRRADALIGRLGPVCPMAARAVGPHRAYRNRRSVSSRTAFRSTTFQYGVLRRFVEVRWKVARRNSSLSLPGSAPSNEKAPQWKIHVA